MNVAGRGILIPLFLIIVSCAGQSSSNLTPSPEQLLEDPVYLDQVRAIDEKRLSRGETPVEELIRDGKVTKTPIPGKRPIIIQIDPEQQRTQARNQGKTEEEIDLSQTIHEGNKQGIEEYYVVDEDDQSSGEVVIIDERDLEGVPESLDVNIEPELDQGLNDRILGVGAPPDLISPSEPRDGSLTLPPINDGEVLRPNLELPEEDLASPTGSARAAVRRIVRDQNTPDGPAGHEHEPDNRVAPQPIPKSAAEPRRQYEDALTKARRLEEAEAERRRLEAEAREHPGQLHPDKVPPLPPIPNAELRAKAATDFAQAKEAERRARTEEQAARARIDIPAGDFPAAWDGNVGGKLYTVAAREIGRGAEYTGYLKEGLAKFGTQLLDPNFKLKNDNGFCPNFNSLNRKQRMGFWIMLMSAMARWESAFNTNGKYDECWDYKRKKPKNTKRCIKMRAKGQDTISRGVIQLGYVAIGRFCGFRSPQEINSNPKKNIQCAAKMMNKYFSQDRQIGTPRKPWRGGAKFWSVFRFSIWRGRKLREVKSMQTLTNSLSYCN